MANVSYFYVGTKPVKATGVSEEFDIPNNPIFNFSKDFVSKINAVSPLELGQSIPYVSLSTVDVNGGIIENLNINHFHRAIEVDKIATGGRFADRPSMSLKSLELKSDQAGGYLYYTNVTLAVKVHSPESLEKNATLTSMLIPGVPLLLEYGWNSPNEFLNKKEKMLFQVQTYNLTIDTTGQIDITVKGMALNETFNHAYIGDVTFDRKLRQLEDKLKQIKDLKEKSKKNHVIKRIAADETSADDSIKLAKGPLRKEFAERMNALLADENVEKILFTPKDKKIKTRIVRFHEVIDKLCKKTFEDMSKIFPTIKKINVVYGSFNETETQTDSIKSVADFPIDVRRFEKILKEKKKNGFPVITIGKLFEILYTNFVENEDYWTLFLAESKKKIFRDPSMAVRFSNNGDESIIHFLDVGADVPPTLTGLINLKEDEDENLTKEADIEKKVAEQEIPIIRLGHANSFIKSVSMSHIMDQHMKAALIERANSKSIPSVRSPQPPALVREGNISELSTPFTLPLRGTATVLGHIDWKPFRSFYLSAGVYVINAMYKILGVQHKLSSEGFETTIDFMYH